MDKDDKRNVVRFQNYLDYAPKIVVPVTLRGLQKPLRAKDKKDLEAKTEKLADASHPARCTSAQYVDRNGEPLLYYFGRRLVRAGDKKVSLSAVVPGVFQSAITPVRMPQFWRRTNTAVSRCRTWRGRQIRTSL